jgi:hypothetical protein
VTVRIFTSASEAVRQQWAKAISDKWSGRMDLQILRGDHAGTYPISVGLEWAAKAADADYVVKPNDPGATADGRAGQGGTISMTGWGTKDSVDVTHEFGHMLGNAEEYFTTNGVDYTHGGKQSGFRNPGAGVMNNPADAPFERHYNLIGQNAAEMLGLAADAFKIVPHQQAPQKDAK